MLATPQYIRVDVWWVGLLHKMALMSSMAYIVVTLMVDQQWAAAEKPTFTVHSWASPGAMYSARNASRYAASEGGLYEYCSNAEYAMPPSVVAQSGLQLDASSAPQPVPRCAGERMASLTQIGRDEIFFETARYQHTIFTWTCSAMAGLPVAAVTAGCTWADGAARARASPPAHTSLAHTLSLPLTCSRRPLTCSRRRITRLPRSLTRRLAALWALPPGGVQWSGASTAPAATGRRWPAGTAPTASPGIGADEQARTDEQKNRHTVAAAMVCFCSVSGGPG